MLPKQTQPPEGHSFETLAAHADFVKHPTARALVARLDGEIAAHINTLLDTFPAKDEVQVKTKLQEIKTLRYALLCLTTPQQVHL